MATPPAFDALTANAVLVAVRQAANVLCDRWSLVTLLLAHTGVHRFNDFLERGGMASRLLQSRLAVLEEQEIVVRLPYMRRPLRYDYYLSNMGLALFDVFATMARWEQTWHPPAPGTGLRIQHVPCGHGAVHPVPRCGACDAGLHAADLRLTVSARAAQPMPTKETTYRRSSSSPGQRTAGPALPLAHVLDVYGDKWGIELVNCLFNRVRTFTEFRAYLGISTNILTDRLVSLAALGILRPTTDADHAGKGAYVLTDKGTDLFPIMIAIQAWADHWLPDRLRSPVKLVHRLCEQPLQLRVSCNHCGQPLQRTDCRFAVG